MIEPEFHLLLAKAQDAFARGDLAGATRLFDQAESQARRDGEGDWADRAACNSCYVEIQRGHANEQIPRLRRLFLGTLNQRNRCTAAYNLAEAFRDIEDFAIAMEWADRASELSHDIDDPSLIAGIHNQRASLALRFSRFGDAEIGFNLALDAINSLGEIVHTAQRATVLGNLGYTLMCTDRIKEGLKLCEEARLTLEELSADNFLYENLQDLCYGYILDEELERAQVNGERALRLAKQYDDHQVVKNCLFLLAEIAVHRGNVFGGRRYLQELTEHYPEIGLNDEIIDVFLTSDLMAVVNLRG